MGRTTGSSAARHREGALASVEIAAARWSSTTERFDLSGALTDAQLARSDGRLHPPVRAHRGAVRSPPLALGGAAPRRHRGALGATRVRAAQAVQRPRSLDWRSCDRVRRLPGHLLRHRLRQLPLLARPRTPDRSITSNASPWARRRALGGGTLLGVMSEHTTRRQEGVFPAGTPDRKRSARTGPWIARRRRPGGRGGTGRAHGDLAVADGWIAVRRAG